MLPSRLHLFIFFKEGTMLQDAHGRKIDYLRLSLTEKCNLRCAYCMPPKTQTPFRQEDLLDHAQMLFLVQALAELGIQKIRLTGGEPLLYPDLFRLIGAIKKMDQIQNISLTTNGVLLDQYLKQLKALEIDSINISLDTIDSAKYKRITGFDYSEEVFKSILQALDMGFKMIKINSVISSYVDQEDIIGLIKKFQGLPVVLRFIEMMPTNKMKNIECQGSSNDLRSESMIGREKLIDLIRSRNGYAPTHKLYGFGPARYYSSKEDPLVIGVIHNHDDSCFFCNRLRLTSQGKLLLCIFSGKALDLKKEMDQNLDKGSIKNIILDFIKEKPKNRTTASNEGFENCLNECMYKIGG